MRLRAQFALLFTAAAMLSVGAVVLVAAAADTLRDAALAQTRAQVSLREARGLLVLSYEFALYGHERSAMQWRVRYSTL